MKHSARTSVPGVSLTPSMLATLMQHAETPRRTRAGIRELRTLQALKQRGLIYFNRLTRPTHTSATARGRQIIAAMQQIGA